jgi:putative ABC transport system ATP-binding protein
MTNSPLIQLTEVTKSYSDAEGEVTALAGVDLEVETGEFVAVMGPSGSGKSSLLHLIGALDAPTSGSVVVDGVDLGRLSRRELAAFRRDRVGFVFQAFNLLPQLSAFENAALPAVLAGLPRASIAARIDALFSSFGLGSRRDRLPGQLSGGEQQRVAVARALAMDPDVVLADEPTGSLDSVAASELMDILSNCHGGNQTIVLVTHDPLVASRAERILHMRDGRFSEQTHLWRPTPRAVSDLIAPPPIIPSIEW